MTTIVMLGRNGYIGRNVTEKWLQKDKTATFYVLSRSGKNSLQNERITDIAVDVTDFDAVLKAIPEKVDYIVDFVGRPEKDPEVFKQVNDQPAQVMLQVAKAKNVKGMGFIGGTLGPKPFVEGKARLAKMLKDSGIPTTVIAPTVVYGNGRSDAISKMVPLFKFLAIFSKNFKPVTVEQVSTEMVDGLLG
ncbi:NAD-dependent epimerase/dehydratase family protein [Streptococcus massiliensis]|uniref:NAD dependent epimerase/dehydratase n=1 Tax=Streptococcus massiliensis TaxID=313439 RepID=A0A380KW20_9STRE|nr:NAD-dependent epimerase/dehydratase family protein [Streptococcus massiliensis]SUN75885.1 NAD dependent epimerase/dehydratase [Streptococcus massiliensis]